MRSTHVLPNFRIAVVGSGAVGGYYGAKLAYLGRDVHFLVRGEEERATLKRFGLQVKSREGNFRVAKVNAHASTADIGPVDLVLIALKATANDAIPALIPPLLKSETVLLTLQNGLGNEEFLAERFGAERVMGGLCFVCLNRTAPGVIEHQGYGNVTLGEHARYPLPRTHDIAWEFKRCGVPSHVTADLATERWRKLVWNIPFNGLTILASAQAGRPMTTADILADDSLSYLCRRLMDEVISTANRLGHAIPTDFSALQMKRTAEMGAYRPSSLLDYLGARPVELEAIWGEAHRRAFNAGIDAGRLETLYYLLRQICSTIRQPER
jgi:2-dehydropantoate 2-reductase